MTIRDEPATAPGDRKDNGQGREYVAAIVS